MGLFNRKKKEEKQEAEEIPTELPIFMRRAIARPLEAFVDKYPGNYIVVPTPEEFREGTTLAPEIETYTSVVLNIPEVPKHSLIYKLTPPKADEPYKVYTIGRHPAHNDIWVPSNNVSRATHAQIIIRRKNGGLELKLKDANPICSDLKTFVWDEIGARLHQLDKSAKTELKGKKAIALCDNPLVPIYFFESAELYKMLTNDLKFT